MSKSSPVFHYRRFVLLSLAIMAAAVTLVMIVYGHRIIYGRYNDGGPSSFPPASLYPTRGVDLSRHNATVDFDLLADSVDFVYLKATEGRTHHDRRFPAYYVKSINAGLKVGVYHFFRFDVDGESQAENFLWAIRRLNLDLPPAIDVETDGQGRDIPNHALIRNRLSDMIRVLRDAGLDSIIIYTNKHGLDNFISDSDLRACGLWISSFTDPPLSPLVRKEWDIWQFSHTGRLPGVDGYVDLNVMNPRRQTP